MKKSPYIEKEHLVSVPLDWNNPSGAKTEVYCREVFLPKNRGKDILVFLQGGPGFPSPRDPTSYSWMPEVLKRFRLVLLDQRGTGRSQKIGPETAARLTSAEELEAYFACFRGDSIVRDLEHLRDSVFKVKKWFLLGQSYGGFLTFIYLSHFPGSLKGAMVTGGVPPLFLTSVDQVYARLTPIVFKRNMEFYRRFPKDIDRVRKIVDLLKREPYRLPDGGALTAERFQYIGLDLLGSDRPAEGLHYFLDDPFVDSSERQISYSFAQQCVANRVNFETNPIYAVLHEAIYCDGTASHWSAERQLESHGGFGLDAEKVCFVGESIRRSLFEDCSQLRGFQEAAHRIAARNWGKLYDLNQLERNPVPVECLIYQSDYYVDPAASTKVVKHAKNVRAVTHPTWQHDSLRRRGQEVMQILMPRLLKRVKR